MAVHVVDEANRCLQCKNPRCRTGCPINTNIPEMIRLFKEEQVMDAAMMLFANNPLSIVCSLVCDHEKQCEGHCVRGIKGAPVHISAIENYISDSCFERIKLEMQPRNGKKVAVIGGGPAGITIAVILQQRGYQVTIFEGREKLGGVMRYGIPDFRLPKTILDRYAERLYEMGILFRPNFNIGGSVSIQDLFDDGYKSVFIGTGAWRPRRLHIPGETFGNVAFAINYLNNPDVYHIGEKVAVVGAGNAAMDVARTAIRKGAREVNVYCVTEEPAASPKEVEYAKLDVDFDNTTQQGKISVHKTGDIFSSNTTNCCYWPYIGGYGGDSCWLAVCSYGNLYANVTSGNSGYACLTCLSAAICVSTYGRCSTGRDCAGDNRFCCWLILGRRNDGGKRYAGATFENTIRTGKIDLDACVRCSCDNNRNADCHNP